MISDIFMDRVEKDQSFSLFCPYNTNYALEELYGDAYRKKYEELEAAGKAAG